MLNISPQSVRDRLNMAEWSALSRDPLPRAHRMLGWWLLSILAATIILMFLPWRQNIQANGEVTTLYPEQRPQTIQTAIAGRIEAWYVREGELVQRGDTIVHLSEIKTEYFDTGLVDRTYRQVTAKESSITAYDQKAASLEDQIAAMRLELTLKREQLAGKIRQTELKLASQQAELEQARVALDIAQRQFQRTDTLLQRGIKSRTDWEDKRQKLQESQAKAVAAENKVNEVRNELQVLAIERDNTINEYNNKIAKAQADRFSTLSDRFSAEGEMNKMRTQYENYSRRSRFYHILAPQDGYVTEVMAPGIGETVKEGDPIVSLMPADYQLAVALYVRPMDLPLIQVGQQVRFLFDGWPAIVFSGWPDLSFGVYTGQVAAIDNTISNKGMYRVLVAPDPSDRPWPKALRPDSGARGVALLGQVPVWYELWRQLNGFPPDYYQVEKTGEEKKEKRKAPLKLVK